MSGKLSSGDIVVIDNFAIEKPRTKDMVSILKIFDCEGRRTLIVLPDRDDAVIRSSRNIPGVTVRRVSDLTAYEVAVHNRLLMTREAVEKMSEEGKNG
jgi:large subunit ribosomal protein L4